MAWRSNTEFSCCEAVIGMHISFYNAFECGSANQIVGTIHFIIPISGQYIIKMVKACTYADA